MNTLLSSMRRSALVGLIACLAVASATAAQRLPQLGLQAYTFRSFTFAETLDFAREAEITNLQAYSGQNLGGGLEGKFSHQMDPATKSRIREMAAAKGVKLTSYGVVNAGDEAGWRQIFAFAREMGMIDIATEAAQEQLPLLDRLSKEYGIAVTLHNHPTPSRYALPETALAAVAPFGPNFGLCADTGHWARSGLDPVASLKLAEGRILSLHFKDLTEWTKQAHDMPWGTGASNAAGQIAELARQGFSGIAYVEYEHNTPALLEEVKLSAAFFRAALAAPAAELAGHRVTPPGFTTDPADLWKNPSNRTGRWPEPKPLFATDLSNAEFNPGSWVVEDGILVAKGGGDIWTKDSFGNYMLSLEFRCAEGSNSGVFLRCADPADWLHTAIEVQILQGDTANDRHLVGAIFDCLAPSRRIEITPGEWYQYVIMARDNEIRVSLNGEELIKMNLDQWTEAGKNPDGSPNKFRTAYKEMAREGRIGLQYHGNPIEFRNILIEPL
jgi:sugar phosphate isomerase/epimerase